MAWSVRGGAVAALSAVVAMGAGSALAADEVDWHWSVHGPSRAFTKGMEKIAEYVGEKSGGNFNVTVHFGETISPAKEVLDAVKLGSIEGGVMCISFAPGKAPLSGVLDLPFLPFEDLKVQEQVHEAVYEHPAIEEEMMRWDGINFFSALLPQYEFMGAGEPPRDLEGWKGMRVRALGGLGKAMEKLGAVPTTVPSPEIYTALERGMFQAASLPFSYAHGAYKLQEVSRWYTMGMAPGSINCPLVVSHTAHEALPDEYKALLQDAKPVAYEAMKQAYVEADEEFIPMFDEAGLERITYSREQMAGFEEQAGKPVWDGWVEETAAKGLPARELLDFVLAEAEKAGGS